MKIKMIFVVSLFLLITQSIFSQPHGINYLGTSRQEIISTFGKPSKITKMNGLEQLQYQSTGNIDSDNSTSTLYGIKYNRCIHVVTFWNYTNKRGALNTFNYLANMFKSTCQLVVDDTYKKVYANDESVITILLTHYNTYTVASRIEERL